MQSFSLSKCMLNVLLYFYLAACLTRIGVILLTRARDSRPLLHVLGPLGPRLALKLFPVYAFTRNIYDMDLNKSKGH